MTSLFVRPIPKRGRVALMLAGSLLFHGGLVGIGALFVQPPPSVETPWFPLPEQGDPMPVNVPEASPQPTTDSVQTATPDVVEPMVPTPPPVADDPVFAEPSSPTPRQTSAAKPVMTSPPNSPVRPSTSTATLPGNGQSGRPADGSVNSGAAVWVMPHPPYPAMSVRTAMVTGATTVRVTTDTAGRVSNVVVVRSTGNALLDAHTVSYVRGHWSGPANASRTTEFVYQIR